MTSHNQPHKYRCETCHATVIKNDTEMACEYSGDVISLIGLWSPSVKRIWEHTSRFGCASHSDTITSLQKEAEQRIADVIVGLERRKGRLGTYPDNIQTIRTYESVIALLRGKEE